MENLKFQEFLEEQCTLKIFNDIANKKIIETIKSFIGLIFSFSIIFIGIESLSQVLNTTNMFQILKNAIISLLIMERGLKAVLEITLKESEKEEAIENGK